MVYKLGMVGSASDKFTEEGERQAKVKIHEILERANAQHPDLVFVSGRCPIAKCEACGKLKFAPPAAPLEGYFECPLCGKFTAIREGGIDIWGEQEALVQNIPCDIKVPAFNTWGSGSTYGFMARNIDIAKSNEVHIIVVKEYPANYNGMKEPVCYHCESAQHPERHGVNALHMKSGGCFSGWKAIELGNKAKWHIL